MAPAPRPRPLLLARLTAAALLVLIALPAAAQDAPAVDAPAVDAPAVDAPAVDTPEVHDPPAPAAPAAPDAPTPDDPNHGVTPAEGTGPAGAAPIPVTESGEVDEIGRRVTRLADELRSPFCPGKTLVTCTSYQAFELRREMREMVEAGMSDADIVATLVERHGEEVRNPPQPWYTVLVPLLPFIVLGVLLFWIFRKWKERDRQGAPAPAATIDAADAERLARLRARVREDLN